MLKDVQVVLIETTEIDHCTVCSLCESKVTGTWSSTFEVYLGFLLPSGS